MSYYSYSGNYADHSLVSADRGNEAYDPYANDNPYYEENYSSSDTYYRNDEVLGARSHANYNDSLGSRSSNRYAESNFNREYDNRRDFHSSRDARKFNPDSYDDRGDFRNQQRFERRGERRYHEPDLRNSSNREQSFRHRDRSPQRRDYSEPKNRERYDKRPNQRGRDKGFWGNSKSSTSESTYKLKPPNWKIEKLPKILKDLYDISRTTMCRSDKAVNEFKEKNSIIVDGDINFRPVQTFDEFDIDPKIKNCLMKKGFTTPTPIQSQAWPIALSGENLVGIAQTGSGKTLAFIIPALIHIINQKKPTSYQGPSCIVLCPTRELAQQVSTSAEEFSRDLNLHVVCLYGGAPKHTQIHSLSCNPEIIVATPGRILDLVESRHICLTPVTFAVLDEADRMLDMGFEPQIRTVLSFTRPDRQTLMFSATWPREVVSLAEKYLDIYTKVNIGALNLHANRNITQIVEVCEEEEKSLKLFDLLTELKKKSPNAKILVFTETKKKADEVNDNLQHEGIKSAAIHGDKRQYERDAVLDAFRRGACTLLVATDVAARGLDIDDIKYVINFDYPSNSEDYVHRIGRTARADNSGTAYTFFTMDNIRQAADLIKILREAEQTIPPILPLYANFCR